MPVPRGGSVSFRCRWLAQRFDLDLGLAELVELSDGSESDAAELALLWRDRPIS